LDSNHRGWRKAEILGLTWDEIDIKGGIVRLDPGGTKNEEGRALYMNDELLVKMHGLQSSSHDNRGKVIPLNKAQRELSTPFGSRRAKFGHKQ
jgi:integrase